MSLPPSPAAPPAEDWERYSRQILFPGIGHEGQRTLTRSHVAIVGVGATGTTAAALLARAGVGRLTLIDRDFVEPSNLQRQSLFDEQDAREVSPKAEAARRKLLSFNSTITVDRHIADLVPENIATLLHGADLIFDATDNFETRYLINDFAVQTGTPWLYTAAVAARASGMIILPRPAATSAAPPFEPTACLACLFPDPPSGAVETCDTAGILGTAVQLAGALQVTEALKILTGQWSLVRRTLLSIDLWTPRNGHLDRAELNSSQPVAGCPVCDQRQFHYLAGTGRPQITLCGRNSVQIHERHRPLSLSALRQSLQQHPDVEDLRSNDLLLRFRRGQHTLTVFPDGRAVIQGTTEPALARALYARFIGS